MKIETDEICTRITVNGKRFWYLHKSPLSVMWAGASRNFSDKEEFEAFFVEQERNEQGG